MREEEVGKIIEMLRTSAGISQKKLCRGLCAEQMLSKIEYGERIPNKLLLDQLMQRLGKSPDKLDTILSLEEYQLFLKRQEIEESILGRDYQKAQMHLREYIAAVKRDSNLHNQYIYKIMAVLAEQEYQDTEAAAEYLKKAIEATMPGWSRESLGSYLISSEEVRLLLLLGREKTVSGDKEGEQLFWAVLHYLRDSRIDEEERVKLFPMGVYLLGEYKQKKGCLDEISDYCEMAVDMLIRNGALPFLIPLLKLQRYCLIEQGREEEAARLEKQRQCLQLVYRRFGYTESNNNTDILLTNTRQELFLYHEVIQAERKAKKFTQEMLAEDIYGSPEILSRVETGKNAPSRKKFRELMEKLGTNHRKYEPYLSSENFEIYEKKRKINLMAGRHDYKKAEELFQQLKGKLDTHSNENKQYILSVGTIFDLMAGRIGEKEAIQREREALGLTFSEGKGIYRVPMGEESSILNHIAVCYRRMGKRRQAIELLEAVLEKYQASQISLKNHYKPCNIVMLNLSSWYEEEGSVERAIEICRQGIRLSIQCGCSGCIGIYLCNKASALEKLDKGLAAEYYEISFYLSDLMRNDVDREKIRQYYEANFNPDKRWYN